MAQLGPEATDQVTRDAGTKVTLQHGSPLGAFAWLIRQSWKTKFVIVAAGMFMIYAAVATFGDLTGLRQQRIDRKALSAKRGCTAEGISLEQRAACENAREDAREKEWKGRSAKAAADNRAGQAEQKALSHEKQRQRDAAAHERAAAEWGRRLDVIANGEVKLPNRADRLRYRDETLAVLVQLLATTDRHPMKEAWPRISNLRAVDAIAAVTLDRKPIPGASPTARDQVEMDCPSTQAAPGWRARCAATLKRYALEAPPNVLKYHLDLFVHSAVAAD